MIKITNETLMNSVAAINEMGQLKLPLTSIRPMAKTMRVLQTELNDLQETQRSFHKNMPEKSDGQSVEDHGKEVKAYTKNFNDEWEILAKKELELPIDKISIDLFGDTKDFSAGSLMTLDWLIEF